ncbi:XrtA/PEP-CTERM system exopolysaccharide export protein [Muricoccus vinaceus]|uniref:XrtA/PEP-CTERM system exopolysaccharide export protein n=1 Tax=Muricoccus vinaceus TaxID=424704 RepID=A0ABV6IKU2_9PROT
MNDTMKDGALNMMQRCLHPSRAGFARRNPAGSPTRRPAPRAALAALLLAGLLQACSGPSSAPVQEASVAAPDYVIGPGDVLSVFVYRAPELSAADLPVRPDGRFSLPLVQDVQAAGRTPSQLSREIEGRMKQYIREPVVSVMVRSFVGPADRQIRVIGEAAQPLALPFREGMTVLDAMIASRGLTRFAAGNSARIIRVADGRPNAPRQTIPVRLRDLLNEGDVAQNVPLRPGDTLVIPTGWF